MRSASLVLLLLESTISARLGSRQQDADLRGRVLASRIERRRVGRLPALAKERVEPGRQGAAVDEQADVAAAQEVVGLPVAGADPAASCIGHAVLGVGDSRE